MSSIPLYIFKDIYLLFNKYVQMWLLRWKVESPTLEELQNSEKKPHEYIFMIFALTEYHTYYIFAILVLFNMTF